MNCRFLYVIGQLGAGGSERQLYSLLEAMDRKLYRPVVVVWNYDAKDLYVDRCRALGVPLYALPPTSSRIKKLLALRYLVRQLNPEVIHSFSTFTNFATWWATFGRQAVVLGTMRSDFCGAQQEIGPLINRLNTRWPRNQIFNNYRSADMIRQARSFFVPKNVFVIHNGLDLQRFCSLPFPGAGQVHIVGIGSLLPVKRWDRLLRVAYMLQEDGLDFLIKIAGDGPLRETLQQEAQKLGVTRRVRFLGHVDDIPALLGEASFLSHTSDSEGCPNAVMEAMACGRAVVATDVGDIPLLVEDGKTGFVVPRADEARLAQRIATLITNRELCQRMGEAGRIKAEQSFRLNRMVSETLTAYAVAGWRKG